MQNKFPDPMKNNQSVAVGLREACAQGRVTKCENLRVSVADGREVMGVCPQLKSLTQGMLRPMAVFNDSDGKQHLLLQREGPGGGLAVMSGGEIADVATDVVARCAIAVRTGFVVMTAQGAMRLTFDASSDDVQWQLHNSAADNPEVALFAEQQGSLTIYSSSLTLTGTDFSRTTPQLSDASEKKLAAELSEAYRRLAATAIDGNLWMQPSAAFFRLIGQGGETLYTSAPVPLSPSGWQADTEISVTCAKSGDSILEVPQIPLTVTTYRPKLIVSEAGRHKMTERGVRKIEVWVTPQLHPFDEAEPAAYRITRQTTAQPVLTVAVPGATDNFSSRRSRLLTRLHSLLPHIESGSRRVAVIDQATVTSDGTAVCIRRDSMMPKEETLMIERAVADAADATPSMPAPADSLMAEISSPDAFTAAVAAVSGNTVVWGDITPLQARSLNISEMTAGFTSDPFTGVLIAEQADGTQTAIALTGSLMPSSWAAIVRYPDPTAVRLRLYIKSTDGQSGRYGELPLTTSGDASCSIFIGQNLESTPLTTWSGTLPQVSQPEPRHRRPGALVACSLTSPLYPLAALECCHSPVRALHPALRSRSTWDFSRCHLYALSEDAIHAVSVSPQRAAISASKIDNRGVVSAGASVYTPLGVMALHGGNLLKITSSRTDTLALGSTTRILSDARSLAWDEERQRLWLLDDMGRMRMLDPLTLHWSDIPSPADFTDITTVGNRLMLTDRDELYRPETERELATASDMRTIVWASDIPITDTSAVNAVELKMSASCVYLTVGLYAQGVPASKPVRRLLTLKINGPVSAPIRRRFVAPRRPFLSISIEGTVSPDFQLHSISLIK